MSNHLSDADLVALALLPDESADARLHVASCTRCKARMAEAEVELDRVRKEHDRSVESLDPTFWKRQELSIMRKVSQGGRRSASTSRAFAAAAIVAVALGGFWFGRSSVDETNPSMPDTVVVRTAAASTAATAQPEQLVPATAVSTNPWDTESLSEFQPVVDWESWVDDEGKDQGTI